MREFEMIKFLRYMEIDMNILNILDSDDTFMFMMYKMICMTYRIVPSLWNLNNSFDRSYLS